MPDRPNADDIVSDVLKRVSDGSVEREQRRVRVIRLSAVVALIGIVVLAIVNAPQDRAPDMTGAADVHTTVNPDGAIHVQIPTDRHGHFVFKGRINGITVKFLLDTGASRVTVPADIATHLRLRRGKAVQATTAAGAITSYNTVLDSVEVGGILSAAIDGAIVPQMHDDRVLLGVSFLRDLEIRQKDGVLTLIKPPR